MARRVQSCGARELTPVHEQKDRRLHRSHRGPPRLTQIPDFRRSWFNPPRASSEARGEKNTRMNGGLGGRGAVSFFSEQTGLVGRL